MNRYFGLIDQRIWSNAFSDLRRDMLAEFKEICCEIDKTQRFRVIISLSIYMYVYTQEARNLLQTDKLIDAIQSLCF